MKNLLNLSIILLFGTISFAQVGINTTDPKAQLEIKSSNQATPSNTDGIIIPKINAFPITAPTVDQNGMMVFLTQDVGLNLKGFYYWDFGNLVWKNVGGATAGWLPDGNSNGAIKSIGTNDNFALPFKTNGTEKMRLSTAGNLGIGTNNPSQQLHLQKNSTADGGNDFMLFDNLAAGGAGFQFKNTNVASNLWQAFLSTGGDFKIGRAGIADCVTFKTNIGYQAIQFFDGEATGNYSLAMGIGAIASGVSTTSFGRFTKARSFGETVLGITNVDYTPGNTAAYVTSDRLFVIGNGTGNGVTSGVQSNALNMLKNGNTRFGNGSPTARIDVEGEIKISSSSAAANVIGAGGMRWDGTNVQFSDGTNWANIGAAPGWAFNGNSNGSLRSIGTNDNFDLPFETNNTEKMRLLTNGNLGIGTTTPTSKLEIRQDVANAINSNVFRLRNFALNGNDLGSSIVFGSGGTTATNQHWSKIDGFHSAGGNTNIAFATSTGAIYEVATEKMRITGLGNVGIGTSSPNGKLQFANENLPRRIVFWENANNDHQYSGFGKLLFATDYHVGSAADDHVFSAGTSATTSSELMRIKGTGNVGIGVVIPTAKLDINGEIKMGSTAATAATIGAGGMRWDGTNIQFSNGTAWANLGGSSSGWSLSGNSATAIDFIGTTNAQDIRFKRNNASAGFISEQNNAIGIESLNIATTGINNNSFGRSALQNNTTGYNNNAFGNRSLTTNTTGRNNNAFGDNCLNQNTIGDYNSAFGYSSLSRNISGLNNCAFGSQSLFDNTTGSNNNAFGNSSLNGNTTGIKNIAIGNYSLKQNTIGEGNSALGYNSLNNNIDGNNNTAVGHDALFNSTFSDNNTAVGSKALSSLGSNNTAIGYDAQVPLYSGSNQLSIVNKIYGLDVNTATPKFGINTAAPTALLHLSKSIAADGGNDYMFFENTAAGGAGFQFKNTNAASNLWQFFLATDGNLKLGRAGVADWMTLKQNRAVEFSNAVKISNSTLTAAAVGAGGMRWDGLSIQYSDGTNWNNFGVNPSGWSLTGNFINSSFFIGSTNNEDVRFKRDNVNAGFISEANNAFGVLSLYENTTGLNNSAFGSYSLLQNTTGSYNNAVGYQALMDNTTGQYNCAFGNIALINNETGNRNVAIGTSSLVANTSGFNNVGIGADSLSANNTGSNNVGVGSLALNQLTSGNNNIGLGYNVQVPNLTGSNQLSIGNTIYGNGIGTAAANIGIGDSNPQTKLVVNGGLSITNTTTFTATSDNFAVTVGNSSYVFVVSNSTSAAARTLVLTDGLAVGQMLFLQSNGLASNFFSLTEGTSNVDFAGGAGSNFDFNGNDIIQLLWNGNDWCLVNYQNLTS